MNEAEDTCKSLMKKFPEAIDGIHRYAEVYEAKGDKLKAAEYYRKTAEFARKADGFEEESVNFFLREAARLTDDGDD